MAALSDAVDLDTWREICKAAADKAKAGDAKAREWLTRLLLGSEPPRLSAITIKELAEISAEAELASKAKRERMIFDVS